ncbi:hypothetical protein [Arthrobacter sp. Alg241-R88]|uniref:hypothetical protein n=1 Tax=Arthrobacter sp. Alg241-R88 TaxID=2305984 RepID=UPI0013D0BB31|nr:hypothetical protein [Arthrobacter sp. Alg241-R88]
MSLAVPLTVTVGGVDITREIQSMSFRKEAIGGVRSIAFSLSRSLTDLNGLDPLAKVVVSDGRNAMPIAEGRFSDSGRSADASGQRWDCVAFGPAQHASDITTPLIYVDTSLEGWVFHVIELSGAGATFQASAAPGVTAGLQGLVAAWEDGTLVATNSAVSIRYSRIMDAGMKVARLAYNWGAGVTAAGWVLEAIYSTDGNWAGSDVGTPDAFNVAGGTRAAVVVTNFANGRNVADIRTRWNAGAATVTGSTTWVYTTPPQVEALRLNKSGVEVTTGYAGFIYPHQIVEDLLGRLLPEFDGAGATVNQGSTFPITQMAYPDGVTATQVLEDLMGFAPAYRWYTLPSASDAGYRFAWEPWPAEVRYEATLDDGGSFPLSTQNVYNEVIVLWRDEAGRTRTTERTLACALLDKHSLIRKTMINLGSEAGTLAQAQAAGDNFLAAHNVPQNSGTLSVARPIRDVITGAMVNPWELEAGELVRVQGIEAYPDAFNASANDGLGVFRIHAVDYNAEENMATLALDSDPRETEDKLVALTNQRTRA